MQAKISTGNNYVRFPQVIGGYLPASASKLRNFFVVDVKRVFIKLRDVSFYPVSNSDENNHLLPLKSMLNLSKLILFQKMWTVQCWLFNPLSEKNTASWQLLQKRKKDRKSTFVTFSLYSHLSSKGKMLIKIRFGFENRLKHSAF